MTSLLRCKACGFIIKEGKLKDRCPACGVPRTAFEPYDDKMTEKRRKILELDIHPVVVHFPQAFSVFILFLTIFTLIFPYFLRAEILCSIPILALFLPLVVVAAIFSGAFDGKTRFKKLNTPHLKKKIIFGTIFFVLSIPLAIFSFYFIFSVTGLILILIFSLGCVLCGTILGLIGKTLINAKLPN
jgi:hypothetical protein